MQICNSASVEKFQFNKRLIEDEEDKAKNEEHIKVKDNVNFPEIEMPNVQFKNVNRYQFGRKKIKKVKLHTLQ